MMRVFGHALIFGLAPLLQKLASIVLLPLYSYYLSPGDYGEIQLLSMATGLFSLVLSLELRPGFMRAWLAASSGAIRAGLMTGVMILLLFLSGFGAALFLAVSGPLCSFLLGHQIGLGFTAILAAGLCLDVMSVLFQATLQAQLRSVFMVTVSVAQFILGAGLTVVFVVHLRFGPLGFFAASVVASALGFTAIATRCISEIGLAAPRWSEVWRLVCFSAPLLVAALMYFIVRNSDRILVSQLLTVSAVGIYSMAWTLANLLLTMVFTPIQTSLDVWRYKLYPQPGGAKEFADIFRIAIVLIGIAAVGLVTAVADVFVLVIDPAYRQAALYLPLLGGAVILQAGYSIVASAFYVTGATGQWTRLFAVGAGVQIATSLTLIPVFGIAGAAIGILAANLVLYAGATYFGARLWRVPYPHAAVAVTFFLELACGYLRILFPAGSLAQKLSIDLAALAFVFIVMIGFGLLKRSDLASLRRDFRDLVRL